MAFKDIEIDEEDFEILELDEGAAEASALFRGADAKRMASIGGSGSFRATPLFEMDDEY